MGKVFDFYSGKSEEKPNFNSNEMSFEIEESEEETLVIDVAKLQKELARIKATNPKADIAIVMDEPVVSDKEIQVAMDIAKQIKAESDMFDFEEEE
jgi:preprotein translocase subunit SecD